MAIRAAAAFAPIPLAYPIGILKSHAAGPPFVFSTATRPDEPLAASLPALTNQRRPSKIGELRENIMGRKPIHSRAILPLTAALVVLPIAISVLLAVSALLAAMGDTSGGVVLKYLALACGLLWIVGLVCLVLVEGLLLLDSSPPPAEPCSPEEIEGD